MSDATEEKEAPRRKGILLTAALSVALAIAAAAGGYAAVLTGLLDGFSATEDQGRDEGMAFVPLDPIVVTLGSGPSMGHLTFSAQIETSPQQQGEVAGIAPRLVSTINTYLRAVDPEVLKAPSALFVVRSQLLRRLRTVAGEDAVRDLLVMEFVIS